ncbi:MAG: DNA primase [Bacilli bacterium]|jgi:DNA primase
MMFDQDLINDILKQADIVDIISRYINVIKKGRNYVALCPFHDDKNPSLQISKEKQIFKCFVCETGGNAITFVEKYEKITFLEAVKKVADLIGYKDERLEKQFKRTPINESLIPLYDCIAELQKFYVYNLSTDEGKIALDYLQRRNIDENQIKKFGLGYSLSNGKATIEFLQSKKHSLKTIEGIGIALARNEGTADNNAGRLIFPLYNLQNQVIGFSARRLNDVNKDEAKFVNSPETQLFHKGSVLYNIQNAIQSAKHDGYIYVVEGFMDVFAIDKTGINSVVALMGTAMSKENALSLRRLNVEVRLCLDGDMPGQMAMMKAMNVFDQLGVRYRIVYRDGNIDDPDDILQKNGVEGLKSFLSSLYDPLDFAISYYERKGTIGTVEEKEKVLNHFLPMLLACKNTLELDNYIYKLSRVTGFEAPAIRNMVSNAKKIGIENQQNLNSYEHSLQESHPEKKELRKLQFAEKEILYQMLNDIAAIDYYNKNIEYFYNETYRAIANFIIDYEQQYKKIDVSELISQLESSDSSNKEELVNAITRISSENYHPMFSITLLDECSKTIKREKNDFYDKETLKKALEGKNNEEKARIIADYARKKGQKAKRDS